MHLLLAQKGALPDAEEAIDLGQEPADIVFISAADTELASLASARENIAKAPTLRLANMMTLSHPLSIDVYCEKTIAKSKLVVIRCLGGESYWPYGLERIFACCRENGVALVVLPGDDKPDPGLERFNTQALDQQLALWQYLIHGGAENSESFIRYCECIVNKRSYDLPPSAILLLKSGLWWPKILSPSVREIRQEWSQQAPVVAIVFYRALVQSGNLKPVEALVSELQNEGLCPLPIFVSSLKDDISQATIRKLFEENSPDVVINLTGFAVSSPDADRVPTVLEEGGAIVLQAVLASGSQEAWQQSDQGLSSRDLAMNVVLPEVDGRILSRAIAFKNAGIFDEIGRASCRERV